jgi:UDP-N-acetylmuramoyl-L-alanyl-D-glutamate--2,6-diaminopimelate ligase
MGEDTIRPQRPVGRRLSELTARLPEIRPAAGVDPAATIVTGASLDSRTVRPGDLYIAREGAQTHGIDHLEAARRAGAVAVLTDRQAAGRVPAGLPLLTAPDPRAVVGPVAAWVYGDPAASLLLLGVTGTNGKTTVAWQLDAGLRACGTRTGLVGTIATVVGGRRWPSARTTPEATDLQAMLAAMVELGVTAVAMEVSSHALALGRVAGCRFDVAGFTNLSQDHLDFHSDLASYFEAKRMLFRPEHSRAAVVTVDDEWGRRLADHPEVPTTTLGGAGSDAEWRWSTGPEGGLRLQGPPDVDRELPLHLAGAFNRANAALALVMLARAGIDLEAAGAGVSSLTDVPGRMQTIECGQPFTVFVDYAHTPEAVARVLAEARQLTGDRVLIVLGGGGDRDPGKRAMMGRAAAHGADVVVITDDNPRSEDPASIRAALVAGAGGRDGGAVHDIGDRREAIAFVLTAAGAGDVVVIAGKGHESGQEVDGVVTPFDDADVAASLLADLAGGRRLPSSAGLATDGRS